MRLLAGLVAHVHAHRVVGSAPRRSYCLVHASSQRALYASLWDGVDELRLGHVVSAERALTRAQDLAHAKGTGRDAIAGPELANALGLLSTTKGDLVASVAYLETAAAGVEDIYRSGMGQDSYSILGGTLVDLAAANLRLVLASIAATKGSSAGGACSHTLDKAQIDARLVDTGATLRRLDYMIKRAYKVDQLLLGSFQLCMSVYQMARGEHKQAVQTLRELLIGLELLGVDDTAVVLCAQAKAVLSWAVPHVPTDPDLDRVALAQQSLEVLADRLGPLHPDVGRSRVAVAAAVMDKDPDQATRLLEQALDTLSLHKYDQAVAQEWLDHIRGVSGVPQPLYMIQMGHALLVAKLEHEQGIVM